MINDPELIKQIIDNIKKLSKEDLDEIIAEVNKWYNKEVTDTNVEKDINRCKELIKDKHKEWIGMTNQKAIGNVLKKYEELKVLEDDIQDKRIAYIDTPEFQDSYISKQKIKDLKENIILQPVIVGGRRNRKTLEYGIELGKIKACEELLQESEDK